MLFDRVKVATATTGTGAITLGPAYVGFRSFAAAGVPDGAAVSYVIEDGADWETGAGIYNASGPSLVRVLIASSTGALLNLSGAAKVFLTPLARDIASPSIVEVFYAGDIYTKKLGSTHVRVLVKGPGSGGGSGRRGAAGTQRTGGSGGAGGGTTEMTIPVASLGATETVTVGLGTAGGASITTDDTSGLSSLTAGSSSFGAWAIARGGNAGQPGNNGTGIGPIGGYGLFNGGNGGLTNINAAAAAFGLYSTGGSAGGSLTAANVVTAPGSSGASLIVNLLGMSAGQTGIAQGWVSVGGGAGVASNTGAASPGADGIFGSGGGGGGASPNGFPSGAGGKGGDGLVVVTTYF